MNVGDLRVKEVEELVGLIRLLLANGAALRPQIVAQIDGVDGRAGLLVQLRNSQLE